MNRTEALRLAVERVYDGAEQIDAECIEDHLADLGFEVTPMPATRHTRTYTEQLPLASTSRLPKGTTG